MKGKYEKFGNLFLKRGLFGQWVPLMCEKKKDRHCGKWCRSFKVLEGKKFYDEYDDIPEDEYLRPIIHTCYYEFMLSELLAYEDTREGK